jgi:3'-5' exoribonuclease
MSDATTAATVASLTPPTTAFDYGPRLGQLRKGDGVQGPFYLLRKETTRTKHGDPMLKVCFRNLHDEEITATIFSNAMGPWEEIGAGSPVDVVGTIDDYKGTTTLKVAGVRLLPTPHPVQAAFKELRCPSQRYDEAGEGFVSHIRQIRNPGMKRFLQHFFDANGACPYALYSSAPAALGNHHAYLGGLLEHSVQVTDAAVALAQEPGCRGMADLDILRASTIVHDAGKIHEYTWRGAPIGMSPSSALFNHMITGPIMVWQIWRRHQDELTSLGFTERHALHLMHIQGSHHGRLDWDAVIEPRTMEAVAPRA